MGNPPFEDVSPSNHGGFPIAMLVYQSVPRKINIEPENDRTGKMIFQTSRGVLSGSMLIFRGVIWRLWKFDKIVCDIISSW